MIHKGQGLPLGLKASDDSLRVHAGFDELDRHEPFDRLLLLGHPHRTHAALADLFDQLVQADDGAGGFSERFIDGVDPGGGVQKGIGVVMRPEQALQSPA